MATLLTLFCLYEKSFAYFVSVCAAKKEGVEASELPRKEVMRRLRDRNEPITLFGELEIDSFRRLRRLEIQEPELIHVMFYFTFCCIVDSGLRKEREKRPKLQ